MGSQQWETSLAQKPEMFGAAAKAPAQRAAVLFKREQKTELLSNRGDEVGGYSVHFFTREKVLR